MKSAAAAVLAGLLLAGCGDGASQRLQAASGDPSPSCAGGWAAYPGPPDGCSSSSSLSAPPTASTERPGPSYSPSTKPSSSTSRPGSPAATPRRTPGPVAGASAGQGSATPASTVRPTTSPTPKPRPTGQLVITEEDSGETFTITMSTADGLLRLGNGWIWSQPERDGSSIELAQRQFIQDPGYAEWEIRPVARGTTVIRSEGSLPCHQAEPPCAAPNRLFQVTVVVS